MRTRSTLSRSGNMYCRFYLHYVMISCDLRTVRTVRIVRWPRQSRIEYSVLVVAIGNRVCTSQLARNPFERSAIRMRHRLSNRRRSIAFDRVGNINWHRQISQCCRLTFSCVRADVQHVYIEYQCAYSIHKHHNCHDWAGFASLHIHFNTRN